MQKERPYTGLTAEIRIGDVPLGYMSGIDLTLEKGIIEVLQFGARYQEKVPAIKNWTATADGTVAFAPGGSQQKLYDAFENDEEVTLGIFLDDFVYFEGKAYVSNLNISGSPDDKMSLSCDFEGNGAIILTLPPTYTVTANSGVGGTLTPGGSQRVAANGSYSLTIIPAPGYEVDTLMDNSEDKSSEVSANKYTLSNITADHVIDVTFKTSGGADKSKLRASINYAESLTEGDYTPETWGAVTTALTAAKEVNGNMSASQSQVTDATNTLNTALQQLQTA